MKFERIQTIKGNLAKKRALIVYGPRRIGKTTITKEYLKTLNGKVVRYDVGDDLELQNLFERQSKQELISYCLPYDVIVIDEAQIIKKLGIGIKIMIDEYPDKVFILTGSSSFEIMQEIGEPLTGRHFTLTLLPIALDEIIGSDFEKRNMLSNLLVYGSYPEVLYTENIIEKERILEELVASYLFKEVLSFDRLKSPRLLLEITKYLAFQIGGEVSYNEIAKKVNCDAKTVKRYIDLLEKTFIIKSVDAFSHNLRSEIAKQKKYYFYDLGIRNMLIKNLAPLEDRNDIGKLWENFVFMEIFRKNNTQNLFKNIYFWRTKEGREIDIIIEKNNIITAIECKWSKDSSKNSVAFKKLYPESILSVANKDTIFDILRLV